MQGLLLKINDGIYEIPYWQTVAEFGTMFGRHLPSKGQRRCSGAFLRFRRFL